MSSPHRQSVYSHLFPGDLLSVTNNISGISYGGSYILNKNDIVYVLFREDIKTDFASEFQLSNLSLLTKNGIVRLRFYTHDSFLKEFKRI